MGKLSLYTHITTLAGTAGIIPVVTAPLVAGGNGYITGDDLAREFASQLPLSIPGTLVAAAGTQPFIATRACVIAGVRAACGTAPTGASIKFDVNRNGTTIFTTQANRPEIAISAFVSAALAVPNVTTLAAGDVLTVDVDQIGSTIAGADATVVIEII